MLQLIHYTQAKFNSFLNLEKILKYCDVLGLFCFLIIKFDAMHIYTLLFAYLILHWWEGAHISILKKR